MRTVDVTLNIWPPYPAQLAYITRRGDPDSGYTITHLKAGMAGGKTLAAGAKAWLSATEWNPDCPGLITFPEYRYIKQTFLPAWRKVVPESLGLWHYHKTDHVISFAHNRSEIYLMSRTEPDRFRGPEFAWHIADELAVDTTTEAWELISTRIRHQDARAPFHDSVSTPKVGVYSNLIRKGGAKVLHASSLQNPYINQPWLEKQAETFSPEKYRQEILAEEISLSGRAWNNFSESEWPAGNMHWAEFDPGRPWYLATDMGLRSAHLIIQRHPATDRHGRERWPGTVDVVVGEYTPNNEDTHSTWKRIAADYPGQPLQICTGRDVTSAEYVDGKKGMYFAAKVWPGRGGKRSPQIIWPHGDNRYLDIQYDIANGLILDWKQRRRLAISKRLRSHDPEHGRGILEVMRMDQFPEQAPKRGEFLPDDKRTGGLGLVDMRSAIQYWAACQYPIRLDGAGIKAA